MSNHRFPALRRWFGRAAWVLLLVAPGAWALPEGFVYLDEAVPSIVTDA